MFQKLVSHNGDISLLVDKGYAVGVDSNYLIVRDIPYLDSKLTLQWGAIVAKLVAVDGLRFVQDDHQIFFAGDVPHGLDGNAIANLGGGPHSLALSPSASDVVVQRTFSNKPRIAQKYADFREKIDTYVAIISGPAMERFGADPYTFRKVACEEPDSVFKLHDTLTSRAEITDLSAKLQTDVIAIIGLGGTGGYLFDFLAKTSVSEIRAFDADVFHVHNAFRAPGRTIETEFGKPKAEVFGARYEALRKGITAKAIYIDEDSAAELDGVTFAFVCVDKGRSRAGIFDVLLARGIPFIDVGMGLKRRSEGLNGMARMTYYPSDLGQEIRNMGLAELQDQPDDLYRTNIQISELNAMNAALAVIRYKQLRGFYHDGAACYHLLFEVADLKIVGVNKQDED